MSVVNLKCVLEQAQPHEVEEGKSAYTRYNLIMSRVAAATGCSLRTASAVFSALSPNNDYHGNLRDARTLLQAAQAGRTIDSFAVSTYGQNKRKAWQLAHGAEPLNLIVADKTRNFFLNITDPADRQPVTIDGHMYNIWASERKPLVGLRTNRAHYACVADGVRILASECGLVPCQLQAVLWLTWRRIHGIKPSKQLTFWDDDLWAAGLGFTRELLDV